MLAEVKGGGPQFLTALPEALMKHSTPEELLALQRFHSNAPGDNLLEILRNMVSSPEMIEQLAFQPLQACNSYVVRLTRGELGVPDVNPELAFDVSKHEHAQTAPAASVLNRFRDDVAAYAEHANTAKASKVVHLSDRDIAAFFERGDPQAEQTLRRALTRVQHLVIKLQQLRDADALMVQDTIPLLERAANFVPVSPALSEDTADAGAADAGAGAAREGTEKKKVKATDAAKTRFLLNRVAGQNAFVWVEFLFGMLLSSKGEADLLRLNPYISAGTLTTVTHLITMSMLRANRLGHANRCIGTAISLEALLSAALKVEPAKRAERGKVLMPKLIQVGEELAKTITMARHYVTKVSGSSNAVQSQSLQPPQQQQLGFSFDPRYLVFEFVWNIQLRKKQVEIVNDFRSNLANGTSKVKQMIMGAGKTSVVAPLLALIVADGKSLVLSVVPKALVEMSRTRMRETFAAIMVKRIYTLDFDRSTSVSPAMRRSLENAAANRGVVVATPTTLKSIMLSYVESLQQLKEVKTMGGMRAKLQELTEQVSELAKILALFKEGIMLLDEVDLILHPLKSELNFPIGDKFDLDGSDDGERWSLPIHLLDALFFTSTGRVSSFEQRGMALDILRRLSASIQKGIRERHLQRLPHVTLLNLDFYEEELKPIMAEWAYLWLQKQHLHGIDRSEAVRYMLEGAAARSDAGTKISLLHLAINKIKVASGQQSPGPLPTAAYQRAMTADERTHQHDTLEELRRRTAAEVDSDEAYHELLLTQQRHLEVAHEAAVDHQTFVNAIYDIDSKIDENTKQATHKSAELQASIHALHKRIGELECPRDDSLDNSIVVWYSQAFSMGSMGAGSSVSLGSNSSSGVSGDGSSSSSSSSSADSSVPAICSLIEDMGMSIRRCSDPDEAIQRARDLQEEGLLRCLVVGGDERGLSCGPGCVKRHEGQNCLRCGQEWDSHNGHECAIGGRGSWPLEKPDAGAKKVSTLQMMKSLTDPDSPYARSKSALPALRTAVYSAHSTMREEERMEFWRLGTTVTDDSKQLLSWVKTMPGWVPDEDEDDLADPAAPGMSDTTAAARAAAVMAAGAGIAAGTTAAAAAATALKPGDPAIIPLPSGVMPAPPRPTLRRQSSRTEKLVLVRLREELEDQEAQKAVVVEEEEGVRKQLLERLTQKHTQLEESVRERIAALEAAEADFKQLLREYGVIESGTVGAAGVVEDGCDADIPPLLADARQRQFVGAHSGRDAALAMGWLEAHREGTGTSPSAISAAAAAATEEDKKLICRHATSVRNELVFLRRMALAAKVVAHVNSPIHKKLLNLCHNWLR